MDKIWRFVSSISLKWANTVTGGMFPQLATIANDPQPNEYVMQTVEKKTKFFSVAIFMLLIVLIIFGVKQILSLIKK